MTAGVSMLSVTSFPLLEDVFLGNDDELYEEMQAMIVDFEESRRGRKRSKRSVSFTEGLVSEVRERPRTDRKEIPDLFYSAAEIKEFRREYREAVHQRMALERQKQQLLQQQWNPTPTVTMAATNVSSLVKSVSQLVKSIAGEAGLMSQQEVSESSILVDTMYLF